MSKSPSIGARRGLWAALGLGLALAAPLPAGAVAKPYTEEAPGRGFHLFIRPQEPTPESQWARVQALDAAGRTRAAAKQALALRIYWPNAEEAPAAQTYYARRLDDRGKLQAAFDAYQHLVDHYPGRFEFNDVLASQMRLAKTLMDRKKGQLLFLPGFAAPERAIPLFQKIVASAPEGDFAAEAYVLIGAAHERIYEYDEAIDAYFTALNRHPESPFAAQAAYAQARCHVELSEDAPNDVRALAEAIAACSLFLQRQPESAQRSEIEASLARLRDRQAAAAFARARYYDRIQRQPESALIEYRSFVALFPDASQAAEARDRIAQLTSEEKKK
ncbi:MAG: outer membrane protein assembly factor BamD [Kiritimatiellia bacterium]